MPAILAAILKFVVPALTALPQLITGIESLFKNVPKFGASKWILVELALSQSITTVAQEITQLAPGTSADKASAEVAKFSKAVNDAFVALANGLGIFPLQ